MRKLTTLSLAAVFALAGCPTDDEETGESGETETETGETETEEGCPDWAPGSDGNCFLSGTYTEDITLTPDYNWILRGGVFIGDDENTYTMTIEAGTTLFGESATDGMLVIRRNSKIEAVGTADAPIVMTSSKNEGSRARGDWGGLIVNGNATINACAEDVEGCQAYGEGGTGWYGGDSDTDSSGTLSYVRVEFAGTLISPDNELNGIAFQGVGSPAPRSTTSRSTMNADDGIEFFGGTANMKYAVVTAVGDDSLDWTDGWRGKAQHIVLHQWDDAGDNGIEADNNGENNELEPMSQPWISNITIVGSPDSSASDLGMLLREGTGAHIYNALVIGMNDSCLDVDHDATWANVDNGDLTIENSHLSCDNLYKDDDDNDGLQAWYEGQSGNTTGSGSDVVSDPFNLTAPNYASAGAATSGGGAPSDSFFDAATYKGGVDSADDWTAGWTNYAAN